jgi:hypothetical protein
VLVPPHITKHRPRRKGRIWTCNQIWVSGFRDQKVLGLIGGKIQGWTQWRLKNWQVYYAKQSERKAKVHPPDRMVVRLKREPWNQALVAHTCNPKSASKGSRPALP